MGFLDWGRNFVNNLPVVGGLASSIWGDPDQERVQDAYKQAQQGMAKQRMYNMDARTNLMNQGALAFGPRNQMLGQMMGQGQPGMPGQGQPGMPGQGQLGMFGQQGPAPQAMDLSQILRNPMSAQQKGDIRDAAFGAQNQGPGVYASWRSNK